MAHPLEFQVDRDALGAGRIGRVLEMPAALTALQLQDAAPGRLPEWLCPFVRDRDRPCYVAPVAHYSFLARSRKCAGNGMRGSKGLSPLAAGASDPAAWFASASATILRISWKASGALRPNSKIRRKVSGWFQTVASTTFRIWGLGCLIAHSTSRPISVPSRMISAEALDCIR